MNAKEFSRLYAKTYGVTNEYAITICDSVFKLLGNVLYEKGEDVGIYGFGSFKHKNMAEKRARHPKTGEMIMIPERDVIKFKPTETLKIEAEE